MVKMLKEKGGIKFGTWQGVGEHDPHGHWTHFDAAPADPLIEQLPLETYLDIARSFKFSTEGLILFPGSM